MNKPKLWVMLKLADDRVLTIRLSRIDGYTLDGVRGFAGRYNLPKSECNRWRKSEQYVFFTDKTPREDIDGRLCLGEKEGSVGAVPFFGASSDAPGENYAVLLRTHGLADAYRTLKGDMKIPWGIILIIVVAAMVAMLGLNYVKSMSVGESEPVFDSPAQEIQEGVRPDTGLEGGE